MISMASKTSENGHVQKEEVQDSDLPLWERVSIVVVWCIGAAYMCYSVAVFSQERVRYMHDHYFEPGWIVSGQKKDASNFEWEYWRDWLRKSWHWYLGHVLIGQLLRWKYYEYRWIFNTVSSCAIMMTFLGWKGSLMVYGHICIAFLAGWTGSLIIVWITAILLLSTLNMDVTLNFMKNVGLDERGSDNYFLLLIFTISMTNLRYISFCSEWCESRKKSNDSKEMNFSFLSMIHYCTYFPTCFTGPVFIYKNFYSQYWQPVKPWSRQTAIAIVKQIARVLFAYFVCELMLHFLYFTAIHHSFRESMNLPMWPLGGSGWLQGQFFMVKYVVLYGIPRIICMLDQTIIPETPSCISRIGSSTKYWRTFDRGLYQFMIRHIYVPLGGSKSGFFWQFVGSTVCFSFVFFWHGTGDNLFYWVLGNYIDIMLDTFAGILYALPKIQSLEKKYLSRANSRRLKGLLKTPFFLMTCVSVFTFLGGVDVGKIFLQRFIYEATPMRIIGASILGYCLVQTDYVVSVIEKRRVKKPHSE